LDKATSEVASGGVSATSHSPDVLAWAYLAHQQSCSGTLNVGFPCGTVALKLQPEKKREAYETIPNAWYSMIDERLIRPRRPCCIPRLKRIIATFDEGWRHSKYGFWHEFMEEEMPLTSSISTGTSRTKHQGRAML
jgi:hypothetical protein